MPILRPCVSPFPFLTHMLSLSTPHAISNPFSSLIKPISFINLHARMASPTFIPKQSSSHASVHFFLPFPITLNGSHHTHLPLHRYSHLLSSCMNPHAQSHPHPVPFPISIPTLSSFMFIVPTVGCPFHSSFPFPSMIIPVAAPSPHHLP